MNKIPSIEPNLILNKVFYFQHLGGKHRRIFRFYDNFRTSNGGDNEAFWQLENDTLIIKDKNNNPTAIYDSVNFEDGRTRINGFFLKDPAMKMEFIEVNCCQFRSTTKESFSIVNHCSNMG